MKLSGHTKYDKYYPLLVLLLFLTASAGYLARPVWFDEVIEIDWLRFPLWEIPFHYEIPNNHIFYTLLLKIMMMLTESCGLNGTLWLRLVSFFFGIGCVLLIYFRLKRTCGALPSLICTGLLAISEPMRQFSTALRGYMPGLFFTFSAFLFAEKWLKRGGKKNLFYYIVLSLLSIGTLPSDMLIAAGSLLFLLPFIARKNGVIKLFLLLILQPVLVLIWYLPIMDQFLEAAKLPEGWNSRFDSFLDLVLTFIFIFLPVLAFTIPGFRRLWKYRNLRLRLTGMSLALAFPLVSVFLFAHPPFPRLFFPFIGVCTLIICTLVSASGKMRICAALAALWIPVAQFAAEPLAKMFFGPRGDDLLSPYFLHFDYRPQIPSNVICKRMQEGKDDIVFIDFDSDPPSIKFLLINKDFPDDRVIYDRPDLGKVVRFTSSGLIICNGPESLFRIKEKFGLTGNYKRIDTGSPDSMQQLYLPTE